MKTAEQWCMILGQLMDEADPDGDELDVQAIPIKVVAELIRNVQKDALKFESEEATEKGALTGYAVSRRGIMEQAKWDPIVYRCLTIWRHGDLTWDEAMALAVFELSKVNRRLQGELEARLNNQVNPMLLIPDPSKKEPS